jgi:4-hydroxybenzoate polyprenyltransferase
VGTHVPPSSSSRLLAYSQLLRLPNVFTAIADVAMGFLITHDMPPPWPLLAIVLVASVALYWAGMVLNDYYDRDRDAAERPTRPIPSGRVPPAVAWRLGFGLLAVGISAGWTAAAVAHDLRPGMIATTLAAAVWCYDALAKQTPLGPLVMGSCRSLNVLLGMSTLAGGWQGMHFVIAGGIGLYIVGVTWLARTEAVQSRRAALMLSTLTMLGGIALLAWYPAWATDGTAPAVRTPYNWTLFWSLIAVVVTWRCLRAVADPRPVVVQGAVKNSILSLIVLDAAAVIPAQGIPCALAILCLLIPTILLGRSIYST